MAVTDPIGDFLTRIRNAQLAGHRVVEIPSSGIKRSLTEILYRNGYIYRYQFDDSIKPQSVIRIALKYDAATRKPIIRKLERISKPGLRKYAGAQDLPRVINGLGIAIVSTSDGVMTDKEARRKNVGGEVLCRIY
ncbi:MAG: 30S ribosomal protein S8 [Saprospiraceae bacterium]